MATCQTAQWVSTSPYVKLTVTESANTATTATLSWTLQYIASYAANTSVSKTYTVYIGGTKVSGGTFSIDGKTGTHTIKTGTQTITKTTNMQTISFSCSFAFNLTWSGSYKATATASGSIQVGPKTSYPITYNANGGTGAPSRHLKYHDTNVTLSSTKPTRSGYSFQGWGTSASDTSVDYAAGATYSGNAALSLYAIWKANTYTVRFDANGGTGAPANQTKTHGIALTLSSAKPTRTNYTFKGWGTSASATTVAYSAGGSYVNNVSTTLYAVWELSYIKPRITNVSVERCTEDGSPAEDGTSGLVSFDWECDQELVDMMVMYETEYGDDYGEETIAASGTSGHASYIFGSNASGLNSETTYKVSIYVEDGGGYSYAFTMLYGTRFVLDFLAGGRGAAFNKPAELEGVLDVAFQTRHLGGLLPPVLEPETDLNDIQVPNTYIGANISNYNYANCPVTSGTFTLVVESCGEAGQVRQTYISCSKYKPERFVRFYYQNAWGDWFWAGTEEVVLYENSAGSNGTITLSAALTHYRYVEIYFTDNNGKNGGYTKVWQPNGETVSLHIQEASATIYSRQTTYYLGGTTMTPDTANASYVRISGSTVTTSVGTNYIKIIRVIGRA